MICPLSVVPHWRRTISDMGDGGAQVVVVNYDRTKNLLSVPASASSAKRTKTKNKNIAKSGEPLVEWDVVIMDESHKCKAYGFDEDSQRALACASLARYTASAAEAPFVIWASATAAQTPATAGYLAPILAQATGTRFTSVRDFGPWLQSQGFHVAPGRYGAWEWTKTDSEQETDIALLRGILFDRDVPLAIRRLPDWAHVEPALFPVEFSVEERRLYDEAWTTFRDQMLLARRGQDARGGLVAKLRFRQKASLLRVGATVDYVMDLLENGHQVVISVQFSETLDQIAEALSAKKVASSVIDGRLGRDREVERLRFQAGHTRVVLTTITEGISLHAHELLPDGTSASSARRSTIIHDPRHSGIDMIQIFGRAHRDYQTAIPYLMFAASSTEEAVVKTLLNRIGSTKSLVGDDVKFIRQLEDALLGTYIPPEPDSGPVRVASESASAPVGVVSVRVAPEPDSDPARVAAKRVAPVRVAAERVAPVRAAASLPPPVVAKREAVKRPSGGRKSSAVLPTARASFRDQLAGGKAQEPQRLRTSAAEAERFRRQLRGEEP